MSENYDFLSQQELLAILALAYKTNPRDHLMVLFAFKHGLRASEVCNIRLSDIKDNTLTVARGKGSETTVQPLMPHTGQPLLNEIKSLREYLKVRPTRSGDALFPSRKGGAMDRTQFFRLFQGYALRAGVHKVKAHTHVLKHTCANVLVRRGMNPAEVQVALGHANITSTMKYISISDQEAAEKVHDAMMSAF